MEFFTDELIKLKEQERVIKRQHLDIEEKIRAIEDLNYLIKTFGIVCDFLPPSLEDWTHFEHMFERYDGTTLIINYDRRWVGFHELSEYDHMQEFILPRRKGCPLRHL